MNKLLEGYSEVAKRIVSGAEILLVCENMGVTMSEPVLVETNDPEAHPAHLTN